MQAVELIRKKRDGHALDPAEIEFFVEGVTAGTIPDYQASAWLMAVVWRGMASGETRALCRAMVRSGTKVDLADLPAAKVDKHSTGGVGDKTSPILAALVAACGVAVPMISGRGLGHTGGTLDKLESIPGFRTDLSVEAMREALGRVGCCLMGPTAEIAPADRLLYRLRDVTATVESVPLIAASIMSKKIAEGIDGLVLDVTVGRGAFMKTLGAARELADELIAIGAGDGVRTEAMLTSMDAPRGRAVGNAIEIVECIETLKGRGPADVERVSVALAARMLLLAGVAESLDAGEARIRDALGSGAGVEKLREIIVHQGGEPRVVDDPETLPSAPHGRIVAASRRGYVEAIDAELVGRAAVALGAGRTRVDEAIDHAVGLRLLAVPGDEVARGDGVIELRYRDAGRASVAQRLVEGAIQLSETPPQPPPIILESRVGQG